jgi:hypothetical protein
MNETIETFLVPTQDDIKQREDVAGVIQQMSRIKTELGALKVKDETSAQLAGDLIAQGKKQLKEWEGIRKALVEPFNLAVKSINSFFNPAKAAADKLLSDTQKSIMLVLQKIEIDKKKEQEKLLKEQEKINKQREKAGLEKVDMVAKETEAPRQVKSGASTSYTVKKKVVQVDDLWTLNVKVLQAMVDGGVEKIPGCSITEETSLRTRGA